MGTAAGAPAIPMTLSHPDLWWVIDGQLAGMPMPLIAFERRYQMGGPLDAFQDDLPELHRAGIRAVVSLLNLPSDAAVYAAAGFRFACFPMANNAPPSLVQARQCSQFIDACLADHLPVAVHCEAGIGRTGTMLAAHLILHGLGFEAAVKQVRSAQPVAIESKAQMQFLHELAARRAP